MTAFKSDGAMHLRGKAAKRWVTKIKREKAEQEQQREREESKPSKSESGSQ